MTRRASDGRFGALRRAAVVLGVLALACAAAPVAGAAPVPGPPSVVDGPSPDIVAPTGLDLSVARDGSGGLVYLKEVGGVEHVFASRLVGGVFQAPVRLDAALAGPSSQPVVAAGYGGLVLVAFVNGGALYVASAANVLSPFSGATVLAGGSMNPSLEVSYLDKGYLAFTALGAGGHDVRSAYYYQGRWSLETSPLDASPGDDAGTGSGRPQVAAAGDGVGVVAWGEAGHIYTRRVWGTSPSVVHEQADGPLPGCAELSSDEPSIGVEGDSSYAQVAFHEQLSCAGATQSRVLSRLLRASVYEGLNQTDGPGAGPADGADQPRVAMGEYGHGWVTSVRDSSHDVYAMALGDNGSPEGQLKVNALPNASAPVVAPAIAGISSDLIAWEHDPGTQGPSEIRVRYAPSGGFTLGPETVLSSPAQGPTDAAGGLSAAGDYAGEAVVAWLQGTAGSMAIMAAELYQPPGSFGALKGFSYSRSSRPLLQWSPAPANWGPVTYRVSVDGVQIGRTQGTAIVVPTALRDGRHRWQVTAVNPAGQTSTDGQATVFVDTHKPKASIRITGQKRAGSTLQLRVTYTDAPPPIRPANASGVGKVTVSWGDGHRQTLAHKAAHAYLHAGRYKVTVVVTDRAGNTTTIVRYIGIAGSG